MGNYYDDYTGSDSNGDGIGDTAYTADKGTDQYPLMLPFPIILKRRKMLLSPTIPGTSSTVRWITWVIP